MDRSSPRRAWAQGDMGLVLRAARPMAGHGIQQRAGSGAESAYPVRQDQRSSVVMTAPEKQRIEAASAVAE